MSLLQCAKKVLSDSQGLVDFLDGLLNSICHLGRDYEIVSRENLLKKLILQRQRDNFFGGGGWGGTSVNDFQPKDFFSLHPVLAYLSYN